LGKLVTIRGNVTIRGHVTIRGKLFWYRHCSALYSVTNMGNLTTLTIKNVAHIKHRDGRRNKYLQSNASEAYNFLVL